MNHDQVQNLILNTLKEVQTVSGHKWSELQSSSVPVHDLDGFDSLLSVEVTIMIEEKLECGQFKGESIFVSSDGERALSVGEIAEKVFEMIKKQGGPNG